MVQLVEKERESDGVEAKQSQRVNDGCKVPALPAGLLLRIQAVDKRLAIIEAKPARGKAQTLLQTCTLPCKCKCWSSRC